MSDPCKRLLELLLDAPGSIGIVGTGSQAREMRRTLEQQFRLRTDDIPGDSSGRIPLGRSLYLLCATPEPEAMATLISRGVPRGTIQRWSGLRAALESSGRAVIDRRLGLEILDANRGVDHSLECPVGLARLLQNYGEVIHGMLAQSQLLDERRRELLETLCSSYLVLRRQWAVMHPERKRRLLFPSPGRSGGVSLTYALSTHPRLKLRVNHEGFADAIYLLLTLHRRGLLSAVPLTAMACLMLDDYNCVGGNPFCFLLSNLSDVPWFECHVLKVERPAMELRESIVERNFHYSTADFVPGRVTAAAWGEMSEDEWMRLSLEAKVDWYIAKVDSEIERGTACAASIHRAPLSDIHHGVNSVLERLGWTRLESFPHLNSIPQDRIYTYEERIRLFEEQRSRAAAEVSQSEL